MEEGESNLNERRHDKKHKFADFYYFLCQELLLTIAYVIAITLAKLQIIGKKNLDDLLDGPTLIVANHRSALDPLLIGLCFGYRSHALPLRFIAKDEFFTNALTSFVFHSLGAYPAFKGQGLDKSLSTPSHILSHNGTVAFFPEGERVYERGVRKGKIGAAVLALRFPQVTIVPIGIFSEGKIGFLGILRRPCLGIAVGKPFRLAERTCENSPEPVTNMFMQEIEKLLREFQ